MKKWLQSILGIDQILWNLQDIRENRLSDRKLLNKLDSQLSVIAPGLGRVIAKLDAKYTESEFSAARKAESDKLGEEVLRRLEAEAAAREPYNE